MRVHLVTRAYNVLARLLRSSVPVATHSPRLLLPLQSQVLTSTCMFTRSPDVQAANYLNIKSLLDLTCLTVRAAGGWAVGSCWAGPRRTEEPCLGQRKHAAVVCCGECCTAAVPPAAWHPWNAPACVPALPCGQHDRRPTLPQAKRNRNLPGSYHGGCPLSLDLTVLLVSRAPPPPPPPTPAPPPPRWPT